MLSLDVGTYYARSFVYDGVFVVERRIVEAHIQTQSFEEDERNEIGYIASYPDGIRENGGQYTHAAVWAALGFLAFDGCSSLSKIIIPESVIDIGFMAFYGCSRLTEITIPDSIKEIKYRTFQNCSNLISITLPNSVKKMAEDSFVNCNSLKNVYYTGSESEWNSISVVSNNDDIEFLKNATIQFNYEVPVLKGDTNGDGELSLKNDVIPVLKNIIGNKVLTDKQIARADMNGDGVLTVTDALMIGNKIIA